jgi:hypothetical protein
MTILKGKGVSKATKATRLKLSRETLEQLTRLSGSPRAEDDWSTCQCGNRDRHDSSCCRYEPEPCNY